VHGALACPPACTSQLGDRSGECAFDSTYNTWICDYLPWRAVARLDVRIPGHTRPVRYSPAARASVVCCMPGGLPYAEALCLLVRSGPRAAEHSRAAEPRGFAPASAARWFCPTSAPDSQPAAFTPPIPPPPVPTQVDSGAGFPPDPSYHLGYVAQFGHRGGDKRDMMHTRNEVGHGTHTTGRRHVR
jgi:hypothetical protein